MHCGVVGITVSDVLLADASDAIVIGFYVTAEDKARILAEEKGVDVRLYKIIYDATNEIKAAMEGMLEPESKEVVLGQVEIRQVYNISTFGNVAGSYVKTGKITRNSSVRLIRDNIIIYDGKLESFRAEIAKKVDADGLHIGQSDIELNVARKILGYDKIIGVSTHNISQARRAQQAGADYIGVGPVFYTATKGYEPPVGLEYLQQVKKEITIPFIAIGGINLGNIQEVLHAGGSRVAICSAIIGSENILEATRSFKDSLMV